MRRHRLAGTASKVALAAFAVAVAVGCNPIVDQPTTELGTGARWRTHNYTYHGPPAWLAVRVDADTGIDDSLTASGEALLHVPGARECIADGTAGVDAPVPCGASCFLTSPARVVWAGGASSGYKRLFLMQEGDPVRVTLDGAAAAVAPDLAAVDDGGQVVPAGSFHDDTGEYAPVAWEIC